MGKDISYVTHFEKVVLLTLISIYFSEEYQQW